MTISSDAYVVQRRGSRGRSAPWVDESSFTTEVYARDWLASLNPRIVGLYQWRIIYRTVEFEVLP